MEGVLAFLGSIAAIMGSVVFVGVIRAAITRPAQPNARPEVANDSPSAARASTLAGLVPWLRTHRLATVAALAALALGLFIWATRNVVRDCTPVGCVLVNRWTGRVVWQQAERHYLPAEQRGPAQSYGGGGR